MRSVLLFALAGMFACGIAGAQSRVTVGNTAKAADDGRWDWTVYVTGPPPVLNEIRCVEYTLHPTFPNPIRRVCARGKDPRMAFPLSTNGWGEFTIKVRVFFAKSKPEVINYPLNLRAGEPAQNRVAAPRKR